MEIFILIILAVLALAIWDEFKKPLWRNVAVDYGVDGKLPFKSDTFDSILFWDKSGNRDWYNGMYISLQPEGIYIYPPFFKLYVKAVCIPWSDIKLDEDIRWLIKKRMVLKITSFEAFIAVDKALKNKYIEVSKLGNS